MALRSPLHFIKGEGIIYEECIPFAQILEEKKKKASQSGHQLCTDSTLPYYHVRVYVCYLETHFQL